jgi:SSS family solute:Na+ symporter
MTGLDLGVIAVYLALVVGVSVVVAIRQRDTDDYYVAGRELGGGYIAASILATQVSAVSLIGGPAFVAQGGGLVWLQYELAVPLATIALIAIVAPVLRRGEFVTIYQYAGRRFGPTSQSALAVIFLLARSLATGVVLYAVSLPLSVAFGFPLHWTLLAIGGFTVLYTTVGGIQADVFSDVLQLVVLVAALLICAGSAVQALGGLEAALARVPPDRTAVLVLDQHGLGDGATFGFWPMVLGGFFLYLSYYGFDQSQAQRLLATRSVGAAQRALLYNGLLRFPLAALYCFLGLLLAAWLVADPQFAADFQGQRADALVPHFLMEFAPSGVRGLFIAGLFAAAMSTLDSSFNSLSAVTMRDVLRKDEQAGALWLARGLSLLWGVFCTAAAFYFAGSSETVIESINRVGSLFYGPVLGMFLLGMFSRRVTERGALGGLLAGLAAVVLVWRLLPDISWLWWNPLGFGVSCAVGGLASRAAPAAGVDPALLTGSDRWRALGGRIPALLIGTFLVLILIGWTIPRIL